MTQRDARERAVPGGAASALVSVARVLSSPGCSERVGRRAPRTLRRPRSRGKPSTPARTRPGTTSLRCGRSRSPTPRPTPPGTTTRSSSRARWRGRRGGSAGGSSRSAAGRTRTAGTRPSPAPPVALPPGGLHARAVARRRARPRGLPGGLPPRQEVRGRRRLPDGPHGGHRPRGAGACAWRSASATTRPPSPRTRPASSLGRGATSPSPGTARGAARFFLDGTALGGGRRRPAAPSTPGSTRSRSGTGSAATTMASPAGSTRSGSPGARSPSRGRRSSSSPTAGSTCAASRRLGSRSGSRTASGRRSRARWRRSRSEGTAPLSFPLPDLAPGARHDLEVPLDTGLRPDDVPVGGAPRPPGGAPVARAATPGRWRSCRGRPPHRMPVVMWGIGSPERVMEEMERLKELGFTHCLGFSADYARIRAAGRPAEPGTPAQVAAVRAHARRALAAAIRRRRPLSPGSSARGEKDLLRVDRERQALRRPPRRLRPLPRARLLLLERRRLGRARPTGAIPAFDAALIHTEVRDAARPCFHEHDRAAFAGRHRPEIPDARRRQGRACVLEVSARLPRRPRGPRRPSALPLLPLVLEGGRRLERAEPRAHRGLQSTGRPGPLDVHDPAVRVASVYGSGGEVDVISQWTYSYPDPIRIGLATDELLAMAAGAAAAASAS